MRNLSDQELHVAGLALEELLETDANDMAENPTDEHVVDAVTKRAPIIEGLLDKIFAEEAARKAHRQR